MNNKVLRGLVAGVCAGMAGTVLAADAGGTDKLGEVVVTATKTAKDTMDAPATVSVVTAKDIENANIHSVDEALTLLPGVYTTRPGGHEPSVMGTNVVMRGIPDYSRTLVLVDGQTLNDPYIGAVTWESVPAETVERIEVVPGPFSSLYGGSAMGGVINIITKTPTKRDLSVKGGYGTGNFKSGSLVYQDRVGERVGIVFDYAYKESDGYIKDEVVLKPSGAGGTAVTGAQRTTDASGNTAYLVGDKGKNGWSSQNLGVKLYVDLPAESRLTLGASQFLYDSTGRNHYNTYLRDASGNPVIGNVTVAGAGVNLAATEKNFLTGPDSEIKEVNRYTAEYETKLGKAGAIKATLGYTDIPLYNNYFVLGSTATLSGGGTSSRMLRPSNELSGSVQASFPFSDRQYLVTGISANKRMIDTITYSVSDWRNAGATGPIQNRTAGEDTSYALYIQDEITLTDRLMAYIGGRYDVWSTEGFIEQVKAPASKNEYAARSQTHFSPKASLVYRPVDATTLRGSVGSSFHAPNLRDTFGWWTPTTGYTYTPNPDLKPETVTSWELGVEQQVGSGTLLRATVYENRLKDLIYRTQDDALRSQGVANAGAATVKGIELEVRQKLLGGLTAFANLTYNDSKITENSAKPATEGKYMTSTPQKMANIGLQGVKGPWSGSLAGHYVGKVYANDINADVVSGVYGSYDAYFVADGKIAYKMKDNVALSLSVSNLGDRRYYQSSLAQGRAYYAEVALKF